MFITLIILIGIVIIFFEHKNKKSYEKVFKDFFAKVCADTKLSKEQKLTLAKQMLEKNGYKIITAKHSLKAKKKIFSLGWFLATLSLYMLFYLYGQKPHVIIFMLKQDGTCSDESSASTT